MSDIVIHTKELTKSYGTADTSVIALLGALVGIAARSVAGWCIELSGLDYPFQLMWFGPLTGILWVLAVSLRAAAISVSPVLKLEPGIVFSEH